MSIAAALHSGHEREASSHDLLGVPSENENAPGLEQTTPDESIFLDDQDGAQAVLQPSISAAASHLTSPKTPAVEKAAALHKNRLRGGYFDIEEDSDGTQQENARIPRSASPDPASSPERSPPLNRHDGKPPMSLGSLPQPKSSQAPTMPSPWHADAKDWEVKDTRSNQTRGLLGAALGPTRIHRSRSAGQEAFKRLQKAIPSFQVSSQFLPSLPTSFFSSLSERAHLGSSARPSHSSSPTTPSTRPLRSHATGPNPATSSSPSQARQLSRPRPIPQRSSSVIPNPSRRLSATSSARPPMLRRVTSDDSILYHNLSRASSLGDDNRFTDVREMVNLRLMALKDSLPDVPNFKMPTLAKMHSGSSKMFYGSFQNMFSSESLGNRPIPEREVSNSSRDALTAFDQVLEELTGDIVVLGGYRGSVLRSAESPHQQLWAPVKLGFNMRKANLEVGLEDDDEENMENTIIPSGMLQHIGPIDVSRKLFKRLRSCENARTGKLRVWDYGYDWRLSPRLSSRKLQEFLKTLPSNQPGVAADSKGALVIAHSLGGLVTRHAVNQRPDLFSGVLYAGAPQRCINILGPFRNGDVVLFNEKLLTAAVNFSIRTSFVFLPEDGFCFVDKDTGEEYPIDFYDPQQWVKWHLSPCVQPPLPAHARPHSSSFSSFFPNSLRARAESRSEKRAQESSPLGKDHMLGPQMNPGTAPPETSSSNGNARSTPPASPSPQAHVNRERYLAYLTRVLADTKQFRAELAHNPVHQSSDSYPPLAVLYGKTIPTVYAAQVHGREAIPCSNAYDDLLFRAGDGVVLAKEAMLPEGYAVVRGGRVSTERGHLTMLGDLPAMAKALGALTRGRRKGIGLGKNSLNKTTA